MKTYMANPTKIERKWYVVDAEGCTLGRLTSEIAKVLRGKNKPCYAPHVDCGDYVIVINSDKLVLTGNKLEDKLYRKHTAYAGHLRETQYKELMAKASDKALTLAVKGMLPKTNLGRTMLKKLKIFKGSEHNLQAQKPETLTLGGKR